MKRKIFSKLLMGALLVASVSSFTSCKDYDDDINSLKEDIKKAALLSDLQNLQSTVAGVKTTADAALSKADAASMKSALESEISAAKKAAMDEAAKGITNAATAQEAAEAAQKTADQAKKIAESIDLTPYVTKTELAETAEAAKTEITNALANYLTADAIEKKLDALKQEVADANAEQLEEMQTKVKNATEAVNSIWSAVTNVSLYAVVAPAATTTNPLTTFTGAPVDIQFVMSEIDKDAARFTRFNHTAAGTAADPKSMKDGVFGDPDKKDFFAGKAVYSAEKKTFTDGAYVKFPTSVIVRVSPTNADLKPEHIALIDGKGKKLGVVEVASVEPYSAYFTRTGSASGLWKINFNLTDAVKANALNVQKATVVKADGTGYVTAAPVPADNSGLFAVAINNTGEVEAAADRNVVSEYGLSVSKDTPIKEYWGVWDPRNYIKVNKALLKDIGGRTTPTTANTIKGAKYTDQAWATYDGTANAVSPAPDRTTVAAVKINNGGTVTVDMTGVKSTTAKNVGTGAGTGAYTPQYYYIVRDDANAGGSDASELNAWNTYTFSGDLGKTLPVSTKAEFTITIPEGSVIGDYIGFRIFAVNYDGTLCDPDGDPFEVWVGNDKYKSTVSGTFKPTKQVGYKQVFDVTTAINSDAAFANPYATALALKQGTSTKYTIPANNIVWKKADGTTNATKWSEVAKAEITFGAAAPGMISWPDDATLTAEIELQSGTPATTDWTIAFELTKNLPDAFGTATWKTGQPGDPANTNIYISYMEPENNTSGLHNRDWIRKAQGLTVGTETNAGAFEKLNDAMNNLEDGKYYFTIENVLLDGTVYTKAANFEATGTNYFIDVAAALVDNKTAHNVKWYTVYENVSSSTTAKKPNSDILTNNVYVEGTPFTITFACPLDPSVMAYSWAKTVSVGKATFAGIPAAAPATVEATITDLYAVYNKANALYVDLTYDFAGVTYTATKQPITSIGRLITFENSFDNAWFFYPGADQKQYSQTTYYFPGTALVANGFATANWTHEAKASIVSASNSLAEYFLEGGINGVASGLTLPVNSAASQPASDIDSKFIISAWDAFGHNKNIVELPIVVKRQ